jgi:hypothetical protein
LTLALVMQLTSGQGERFRERLMAGTKNAAIWKEAVSAGEDCPGPEMLDDLTEESSSKSAATHVAGCPHCQSEIVMLRSFESTTVSGKEAATPEPQGDVATEPDEGS